MGSGRSQARVTPERLELIVVGGRGDAQFDARERRRRKGAVVHSLDEIGHVKNKDPVAMHWPLQARLSLVWFRCVVLCEALGTARLELRGAPAFRDRPPARRREASRSTGTVVRRRTMRGARFVMRHETGRAGDMQVHGLGRLRGARAGAGDGWYRVGPSLES